MRRVEKLTLIDVQKRSIENFLKQHRMSNVKATKHFVERYLQRNTIDELYKCLRKLNTNLCQTIFDFELGADPIIRSNKLIIRMKYVGKGIIYLTTCYER